MCVASLGKEANVGHFPTLNSVFHDPFNFQNMCHAEDYISIQFRKFDLCLLHRQICHLRIFFSADFRYCIKCPLKVDTQVILWVDGDTIHLPNADKNSMIMIRHDRSVYLSNLCEADDDTYGNVGLANQFVKSLTVIGICNSNSLQF
jgi:hypothetical protein